MRNPLALHPDDKVFRAGSAFGVPLVVKGFSWLPFAQLVSWLVLLFRAGRKHPKRTWGARAALAAGQAAVLLGSEWGHNLAHAVSARNTGKPMDAIRIVWGMPLCVYYDINSTDVTPRQHITRALGGPVFNALVWALAGLLRTRFRRGTAGREVMDVAVGTNAFLATNSLLPIPFIDGGPILKWTLVENGLSIPEADEAVRKVNGVLGLLLSLTGLAALRTGRHGMGAILAAMGLTSIGVAKGLIRE